MGQSAQTQDMFSVPSGGIADFYMSDEDIAAVEREEAQKTFGDEGVAAFEDVAKKMASYGRFGDDRIVHVESGEIVVPRALIEQSPELKESIFSHLREQGVEDPERYVVGSSANSLNPETGLPELFLSKIAKGVKRAFGSVGKVLKKVAPVVLPIALSMTPLGPVYGAAVGSGIGTLMQGGSLEDAMKNAVIAGGTGAIFKGFTGDAGSFGANVKAEFANPGARFSQLGQGITGQESFFRPFDTSAVAGTPTTASAEAVQASANQSITSDPTTGLPDVEVPESVFNTTGGQQSTDPSFLDRAGDYMFRGGESKLDLIAKGEQAGADYLAKMKDLGIAPTEAGYNAAVASVQPGMLAKYGPSVALAGLGAGALGFFDAPEEDKPEFLTGADLLARDRDKYALPDEQITYVPDYNPFVPQEPVFRAAEGGVIGSLNQIGQISDQVAAEVRDFVGGFGGGSMPRPLPAIAPPMSTGFTDQGPMNNPNSSPFAQPLSARDAYAQAQADARRQREGGFMGRVMLPGEMSFDDFAEGYNYRLNNPMQPLQAMLFEDGGVAEVFPRRTGGIMPDEGIAGEDSVRALLMPGEFVMTTDAVKGLGNGNNEQGIRNMYDMMRGLEAKGRAMA